ncbi:MAG: PAS domain-containing protein [Flavobacteriales bacterium]|nr:PAS domain-containing protein [Flavobacteriales bacterium]
MHYLESELVALIKTNESIFDFIGDTVLDGVWYWNLEKTEDEWMNRRFWINLGYDPDAMPHSSSSWQSLIFPEDLTQSEELLKAHLADASVPYDLIVRYRHFKGTTSWIRFRGTAIRDEEGIPIRMLGIHTDITELMDKNSILDECNSAAEIGYWYLDIASQKLFWSDVTRRIHEVPDDFEPNVNQAINFYLEGESREKITAAVEQTILDGMGYDLKLQITTFNGERRWVRSLGKADLYNGRPVRMYGTFQNITKSQKAEEHLNEMLKMYEKQNERLKNFSYIVAHNLRTHAGNIKSLLDLHSSNPEAIDIKEMLGLLRSTSGNLLETIDNLTDVAMMNATAGDGLIEVRLYDVAQSVINTLKLNNIDNYSFVNKIGKDVKVKGIPAYIDSILLNLLSNAQKYRKLSEPGQVVISSLEDQNFVYVEISDNGQGIDMERNKNKMFGMYKTFHRHPEARGLGLFITKNQMEAFGGEIFVDSTLNVGTTFKLKFKK